jgi:dCMP deaminase
MSTAAFVYVPVVHRGYLDWVKRHLDLGHDVFLIDDSFAEEIDIRRKDLRALSAHEVLAGLCSGFGCHVMSVLTRENATNVLRRYQHFVFADEDISDHVIAELFQGYSTELEHVFLRYDRKRTDAKQEVAHDRVVTSDDVLLKSIMQMVVGYGKNSSDWFLQVGAGLVRDNEVLMLEHNEHVPSPNVVDALGSARINYKQGIHIDRSTALHAEGALFARALREGVSFRGADLFVSVFPCPYCAPIVARSGIRRLYFAQGYSMLEGEDDIRQSGIEIIRVSL